MTAWLDDSSASQPDASMWGDRRIIWVQSAGIQESMDAARRHNIELIGVSPEHGFAGDSLNFLREYPDTTGLVIPFADSYSLKPVYSLNSLRYLQVSGTREGLDLGAFPALEELRLEWHTGVQLPALASLKTLYLRDYQPNSEDLSELPEFPCLAELELSEGSVTSLTGISRYRFLGKLTLGHLKRLESLRALCDTEVEFLDLEYCKGTYSVDQIACLKFLVVLRVNFCKPILSLSFIEQLPRLEEFRFVRTVIASGDLTPLFRLKTVGFLPRRGYSHTPTEVAAEIRARRSAVANGDSRGRQ